MQIVTSQRVQSSFGAIADIAKSGEPVTITQYRRPALMMFSYAEGERLLRLDKGSAMRDWFAQRQQDEDPSLPVLNDADINELVHALRP